MQHTLSDMKDSKGSRLWFRLSFSSDLRCGWSPSRRFLVLETLIVLEGEDDQFTFHNNPQAEHAVEEGAVRFTPVLDMPHDLSSRQQVSGSIDPGTINHVSGLSELAAELSRVDGRGAEGIVVTLPYSFLHFPLDVCLQVLSLFNLPGLQCSIEKHNNSIPLTSQLEQCVTGNIFSWNIA